MCKMPSLKLGAQTKIFANRGMGRGGAGRRGGKGGGRKKEGGEEGRGD